MMLTWNHSCRSPSGPLRFGHSPDGSSDVYAVSGMTRDSQTGVKSMTFTRTPFCRVGDTRQTDGAYRMARTMRARKRASGRGWITPTACRFRGATPVFGMPRSSSGVRCHGVCRCASGRVEESACGNPRGTGRELAVTSLCARRRYASGLGTRRCSVPPCDGPLDPAGDALATGCLGKQFCALCPRRLARHLACGFRLRQRNRQPPGRKYGLVLTLISFASIPAIALMIFLSFDGGGAGDSTDLPGKANGYPVVGERIRRRRWLQGADAYWKRWS